MIVGFDGTILAGPQTGIGYYTQLLIEHLIRLPEMEVRTYSGLHMHTPSAETFADARKRPSHARRGRIVSAVRSLPGARSTWNAVKGAGFKRAARQVDLFHATNYLPPRAVNCPTLPLIHDVSHLRHPQWHPRARVDWLTKRAEEFLRAPLVHTVSQFSAREIAHTMGIPADRIYVTYPGVNPVYRKPWREEPAVLDSYDVKPGRFFLCVGTLEPRKNLRLAIDAYSRLPETTKLHVPLLVVGAPGWGDLELGWQADVLQRQGALRFLGYLDEPVMRVLYQECAAFLFPSVYEGFGMPVSEAMACGSRPLVIAGGAPHEVAGDLGIALAPDEIAWNDALQSALDENWHGSGELSKALRQRSQMFDWDANVQATLRLYSTLLDHAS